MELWQEILANIFRESTVTIRFPQSPSLSKVFHNACYEALCEVKKIIDDTALDDKECFLQIEKIVRIFENLGSTTTRHDF